METFRTCNGLFFYIQWFVFELIFFKKNVLKCFNPMKQKEIIEPRLMLIAKNECRYYEIKNEFTLDMFLKANIIVFVEKLTF